MIKLILLWIGSYMVIVSLQIASYGALSSFMGYFILGLVMFWTGIYLLIKE